MLTKEALGSAEREQFHFEANSPRVGDQTRSRLLVACNRAHAFPLNQQAAGGLSEVFIEVLPTALPGFLPGSASFWNDGRRGQFQQD